jgi:hypothetical protein
VEFFCCDRAAATFLLCHTPCRGEGVSNVSVWPQREKYSGAVG